MFKNHLTLFRRTHLTHTNNMKGIMSDLYSLNLYETPMQEAIETHNIRLVSKIAKSVSAFPENEKTLFFSQALCQAAEHGFVKGVRLLCQLTDPKINNSAALRWAAMKGDIDCVKALIPVSNPKDEDSHALILAAEDGHVACVKALIKVSDPAALDSAALKTAAEANHLDCVKLLIPVSDATHNRSEALCRALKNGFWNVVEELYPHSDLEGARDALIDWGGADEKTQWLEEKIDERSKILRNKIAQKVQHRGVQPRKSKM